MRSVTVGEIADFVEGTFTGDREKVLTGVRPLPEAGPDDLGFLAGSRYRDQLASTRAGAILVEASIASQSSRYIGVADPYYALARVLQKFFVSIPYPEGISPLASIHPEAKLGAGVRVGAFATVASGAQVGDGAVLCEGVHVGAGARIGVGTVLYPNAVVYHGCIVGARCIVHAGAVIGSDGFGFATHGGVHHKIPQIGIVRIEDDVEIGAGSTIDRAALGETVIGAGTKIDNLVQIAHNVKIGRGCFLAAQVGIAGSTEIGDYCAFGGQSGTGGHLRVGSQVMVGAKSALMKDWTGPVTLSGFPARPVRENLRAEASLRKLPELMTRLAELERRLAELTTENEDPR